MADVSILHKQELQPDIVIGGYIFLALAIEGVVLIALGVLYSLFFCLVSLVERVASFVFRTTLTSGRRLVLLAFCTLFVVSFCFISNAYILVYYKSLYVKTECTIRNVTITYPTSKEYDANNGDWCFVVDVTYDAKGTLHNSTEICREYYSTDPLPQQSLNKLYGMETYCFYRKTNISDVNLNEPTFAYNMALEILSMNCLLLVLSPVVFTVDSCIKRRKQAMKLLREAQANYMTFSSKSSLDNFESLHLVIENRE